MWNNIQEIDSTNWRFGRLEFPIFNGEEPNGWIVISKLQILSTDEEEKTEATVVKGGWMHCRGINGKTKGTYH